MKSFIPRETKRRRFLLPAVSRAAMYMVRNTLREFLTGRVLLFIRFYQHTVSPDHSFFSRSAFRHCRFYPSCSEYAASSFRQYGLGRGFMFSLRRIMRCHPFSRGGYDPVQSIVKPET